MTKAKSSASRPLSKEAQYVMDNWDNKKHQPYATVKSFKEVRSDLADLKDLVRKILDK